MAQFLLAGVAMGCIYALVALGFVLIYNATQGLNFAQGEFVMLGAFGLYAALAAGLPYWLAVPAALLGMAVLGYVFQRLVFYPLRDRSWVFFVIATIGFSIMARNAALLIWGPNTLQVPSFLSAAPILIAGMMLAPEKAAIILVTFAVLALQYGLFFHTDLGRRMRASAQNAEMAQLIGIRPRRMIALTFMLSAALAGVAGILVAPIFMIDPQMGGSVILKAFIAIIIGGFGSIPGAVVGGLLVGVLEILVAVYVSSVYKDAISFAVLMFFLCACPRGIFGEASAERV
jgi:branched-chain amino acid transport system permease protein